MDEIRFSQRTKTLIVVGLLALAVLTIYAARAVVGPFLWALVAAYVIDGPIALAVRRTRLPRAAVVSLFYVVFLATLCFGASVLVPGLRHEFVEFRGSLPRIADQMERTLPNGQAPTVLGIPLDPALLAEQVDQASAEADRWLHENAFGLGVRVLEYGVKALLFLVATFYLLLQWDGLGRSIRNLTPPGYRRELGLLAEEIDRVLGVYLRGLVVLVVLMSGVTYLALLVLGLRYALLVAILTGVLELVPFAGPITAGAIAVTIGVVEGNPFGWSPLSYAAVLVVVYLVLRNLEDYLVIPNIIGHAVKVHPLLILFSVVVATDIFGVGGAVLAAPGVGVLRVLFTWLHRKLYLGPESGELTVEQEAAAAAAAPPGLRAPLPLAPPPGAP